MTQAETEPTSGPTDDSRFVVVATSRDASPDLLWSALRKQIAADEPPAVRHRPSSRPLRGVHATSTQGVAATVAAIEDAIEAGATRVVAVDLAVLTDGAPWRPSDDVALTEQVDRLRHRHPDVDVQLIGASGEHGPLTELIGVLRTPQPVRDALADRALGRVFGGDLEALGRFLAALREGLPTDTRLVLRGSAVSGKSYERQTRFDARGPGTSDLDLVAIGEEAGRLWVDEARLLGGVNSLPLCDGSSWVAPTLDPARVAAQAIVGRPVSVQSMAEWFLQLRSAVQGTPYLLLDPP